MKNLEKKSGICNVCDEPLGHIRDPDSFCYKCSGYSKVNILRSVEKYDKILNDLRDKFRSNMKYANIPRYLNNYLDVGEGILNVNEFINKKSLESPLDKNKSYFLPYIEKGEYEKVSITYNLKSLIFANIGIKWILEDHDFLYNYAEDYDWDIFFIPFYWFKNRNRLIYLKNDLGFEIFKDESKPEFYYFKKLDLYFKSLYHFGVMSVDEKDSEKYHNHLNKLFELEKSPDTKRLYAQTDFRLTLLSQAYNEYPDKEHKMFSFENLLMNKQIPDRVWFIFNYYNKKRAKNLKELSKRNHYFVIRDYNHFLLDVGFIPWEIVSFQSHIHEFPLLIEFKNRLYISPTRLILAYNFMREKLQHNEINIKLSDEYGNKFQKMVESILIKSKLIIQDPITSNSFTNIINKKDMNFEIDILAFSKKNIFIIECKSFHFSPFFHLRDAKEGRLRDQFIPFTKKFNERIKPWLLSQLNNPVVNNYIRIDCRKIEIDTKKNYKFEVNLPERFQNIKEHDIVGLYITQINEYFNVQEASSGTLIQIYYEDLKKFCDTLLKQE